MSNRHRPDYLALIIELIDSHRFVIQTSPSLPPVHYTVGLSAEGSSHELAIAGLDPHTATGVLRPIGLDVLSGRTLQSEETIPGLVPAYVHHTYGTLDPQALPILDHWCQRTNRPFPHVTQLFWPDLDGRFPGDHRCSSVVVDMQAVTAMR